MLLLVRVCGQRHVHKLKSLPYPEKKFGNKIEQKPSNVAEKTNRRARRREDEEEEERGSESIQRKQEGEAARKNLLWRLPCHAYSLLPASSFCLHPLRGEIKNSVFKSLAATAVGAVAAAAAEDGKGAGAGTEAGAVARVTARNLGRVRAGHVRQVGNT